MKPWAKAIAARVTQGLRRDADGKLATQYSAVYCLPQNATPEPLAEDKFIGAMKLGIAPAAVTITPLARVFAE